MNLINSGANDPNVFLQEGFRSYLKAIAAITAFEREVQMGCRRVFEDHLKQYASSIRLSPVLQIDEIREFIWPKSHSWEGYRCVGVGISRKPLSATISWWSMNCNLYWEEGDDEICCWIGESCSSKSVRSIAQHLLKYNPQPSNFSHDAQDVGVYRNLNAEQAGEFESSLDELFHQWTEMWQRAGGIKSLLK